MLLIVAATESELRAAADLAGAEGLACGVGPVDAGIAVARRLAEGPPVDAVLHVGIAGCRAASGIELGELVVGTTAVYCDTASPLVEQGVDCDAALLARVTSVVPQARQLPIGTSADVGGTTGCDVEAMEGFAVLRAASLAGIPAIEVRTIANHVEESDRALWRFDLALDNLAAALPGLAGALSGTGAAR